MAKHVYVVLNGFQDEVHAGWTNKREAYRHLSRLIKVDRAQDPRVERIQVYTGTRLIPQYYCEFRRRVYLDYRGVIKRTDTSTTNHWEYQEGTEQSPQETTTTVSQNTRNEWVVYTCGYDEIDVEDESESRVLAVRAGLQGVSLELEGG